MRQADLFLLKMQQMVAVLFFITVHAINIAFILFSPPTHKSGCGNSVKDLDASHLMS